MQHFRSTFTFPLITSFSLKVHSDQRFNPSGINNPPLQCEMVCPDFYLDPQIKPLLLGNWGGGGGGFPSQQKVGYREQPQTSKPPGGSEVETERKLVCYLVHMLNLSCLGVCVIMMGGKARISDPMRELFLRLQRCFCCFFAHFCQGGH